MADYCADCDDTGYVCTNCDCAENDCGCDDPDIVMCESCPDEDNDDE